MLQFASQYRSDRTAGFSLVEVLVVAAISAAIFGALFSSFYFSLELMSDSRARLTAISLATERMEFIRSLTYFDIGTVGGLPPGAIPQQSTTSVNGIDFTEEVLVEYIDDPFDGLLTATTTDINDIPSDYKRIEVTYTWQLGTGATSSASFVSYVVPPSIESTEGGGTVQIVVTDADTNGVSAADVRLINRTTTTTIDQTKQTAGNGIVLFGGAPATSSYEVVVSKPGYSRDRTYVASSSNPNPVKAPFSVSVADVSTVYFSIDELANLGVRTLAGRNEVVAFEDFPDLSGVASSTAVDTALNALVLADSGGVYEANGTAFLTQVSPGAFESWETLRIASEVPAGTEALVRLYTGSSTSGYTLVPDGDLPGNALGFTGPLVDLRGLSPASYSELTVGVELSSSDPTQTPRVNEVGLYYIDAETISPNTPVLLTSDRLIGTTPDVPKHELDATTDGTGARQLVGVEYGDYDVSVPGSDIAMICGGNPYSVVAGQSATTTLILAADTAHTLRVTAVSGGTPIPGADVTLSRPGYNQTESTNTCGQVFFSGVTDSSDYELNITVAGFTPHTQTGVSISGDAAITTNLTEL